VKHYWEVFFNIFFFSTIGNTLSVNEKLIPEVVAVGRRKRKRAKQRKRKISSLQQGSKINVTLCKFRDILELIF
jgi:hypothetical protein